MRNKEIVSYIETKLNEISYALGFHDELGNPDIAFRGEFGFYDLKWVQRKFNVEITPFVLVSNSVETINDGLQTSIERYQVVTMGLARDREKLLTVFDELRKHLNNGENIVLDDLTMTFAVSDFTVGEDFNEGNGETRQSSKKRFEIMLGFEVQIVQGLLNSNDIVVKFGEETIPYRSIKFQTGVNTYINIDNTVAGFEDINNTNVNNYDLIIETYVKNDSPVMELLSKQEATDVIRKLTLQLGNTNIIDNQYYQFDGYILSNERTNIATVFLYFSMIKVKDVIIIDDITIPILDWAVSMKTSQQQIVRAGHNTIKNVFTGKARAYAFTIAETGNGTSQELLSKIYTDLLNDDNVKPYSVTIITGRSGEFTKSLIVDEITKESKETGSTYVTIKMVEGE